MQPRAIVLNMFYTGLGIARTLGERGIPVLGLSAKRALYGNFTRYADVRRSPDSRTQPAELLQFLISIGKNSPARQIVFPTRDDDVLFLDRYREELDPYFVTAVPARPVLKLCIDKWETHRIAAAAGIPAPNAWLIACPDDLPRVLGEIAYPCVLKPVASNDWRRDRNWERVGGRKAIGITSAEELIEEYETISLADKRVLIEEMVKGADDQLFIAACFCDAESRVTAGFTARKLVQVPEQFGTGCIVETAHSPAVFAAAERLLQAMRFTGIAEVEFKRDPADGAYKLIEVNARPWDQHRLGVAVGADVIYPAYLEYARLALAQNTASRPDSKRTTSLPIVPEIRWIAEDSFVTALLGAVRSNRSSVRALWRAGRGRRVFAIWCARDPLPFFLWILPFAASLARTGLRYLGKSLRSIFITPSRRGSDGGVHVYASRRPKDNG